MPCGHIYCNDCLLQLFSKVITNESLYPPRCCQRNIELDTVRERLSPELCMRVEAKALELDTVDRTYCPHATCATFIPPTRAMEEEMGCPKNVTCPRCGQKACRRCKREAHFGRRCDITEDKEVLEVTQYSGFQRCKCGHVVELNTGCYHMTCRCGRQFCYLCGRVWKTCDCVQFEGQRLNTEDARVQAVPRDLRRLLR